MYYEDRRYSDKKKEHGALLTDLKKICKTRDFLKKKKKAILRACSLFTGHFPSCSIFEVLGVFLAQSKVPFIAVIEGYLLM